MTCHKPSHVIFFSVPMIHVFICKHKEINKIENHLNEDFCNLFDWIVDKSKHFGEDKTKSIFLLLNLKGKYKKTSHKIWGYTN